MTERPGPLNQREVDMDFCDKSHKMNSPELRINISQLDIEMKRTPKLDKNTDVEKQKIQPMYYVGIKEICCLYL